MLGIIFFCVVSLYISKHIYTIVTRYIRWETVTASIPNIKCFPIVGSLFRFSNFNNIPQVLYEDFLNYGSPMKLNIMQFCFLICVSEPSQIQTIFNASETEEKASYYLYSDILLHQGIVTAAASRWKTNRKHLNPMFRQTILDDYSIIFIDMTHDLIRDLGKYVNQSSFNVLPLIMEHNTLVIGQTLLGSTLNLEETGFNFHEHLSRFFKLLLGRFLLKPWLNIEFIYNLSSLKQSISDAAEIINTFLSKVIKDKQRKLEDVQASNKRSNSFLEQLLRMNKLQNLYTDQQLAGEISTMFVAGIETTSIALSFVLVLLGIHKNIQNKVLNEIMTVVGDSNATLTYQHLQQMSYIDRVIKEVLRLYPPVPFIMRHVKEDLQIGEHTLPVGAECIVSPFLLHRNPDIWPDPLTFNPDRFDPEESKARHKYAYIPFSAGPRNCIGKSYAMLLLKANIVNILRNFEVLCDLKENDMQLRFQVTLVITDGFNISLRRRI